MNKLKLGSLFDGSGGFPLGAIMNGIEPVWASEIEPFPIRVTTKRIPDMKHYGDVSAINGADLEPVDIITFGSPCQDMSIAGKRAGLDGERSGLFRQAVGIVKEMRCATHGMYPRWIVWENVPGAFSSNGGEDFRSVLEEVCQIADPEAHVPKAKWESSGTIVGDGYSVCWRVFDAQFWGVPQRRRRIYLVADFAGECAGAILFKPESLLGYTPQSGNKGQGIAGGAEDGTNQASRAYGFDAYNHALNNVSAGLRVNCGQASGSNDVLQKSDLVLNDQGGSRMDISKGVTNTLRAESHHPPLVLEDAIALEFNPTDSRIKIAEDGKCQTLLQRMGTGGNQVPLLMEKNNDL